MKSNHINSPENHLASKVREVFPEMQEPNCAKAIAFGTAREDLIRQTAYSFYQARNFLGGHALQDWLKAEAMVNQMPGKIILTDGLA